MADITEDDLWGSDDPNENSNTEIQTFSGTQLAELSPDDLIEYERNNENMIYNDTHALTISLGFCDKVVIAAYQVADYVPPLMNADQSKFWKKEVIPNLVRSLTQDVKARSIISRSFASIRNLSITIQRASEIVRQSKGSPKAIEIAQKNIPSALAKIEEHIEDVSKLEDSVIKVFEQQTEELFKIVGPKAADFVEQKAELENLLNLEYDKKDRLNKALAEKLDEVTRYNHLINAIEKQLKTEESELNESKDRNKELNKMNQSIDRSIQNIQTETSRTETTRVRWGWGWWIFGGSSESTTTHREKNQNADFERNHYESIINARAVRIKQSQNDEKAKQEAISELNKILSELEGKYKSSNTKLEKMQETYAERMNKIQTEIDNIDRQIKDLNKSQEKTENTIGLRGNILIECLVSVRTFAKSLKGGTSAYSPLINILTAIKALVQNEVELLTSSSKADIFLAGTLLMKNVRFITGYSAKSSKALLPPKDYAKTIKSVEYNASIDNIE